jgi:hypothetical protein
MIKSGEGECGQWYRPRNASAITAWLAQECCEFGSVAKIFRFHHKSVYE